MRGLDIYIGFQTVTNWAAVRDSGVRYIWTKATDGTRFAPNGRADTYVNGCRSVGIPPGLYHYAQPGDPIAQANLLADEALRLGCFGSGNLPPALDIEEPGITGKRDWSIRFLRQLQARLGGAKVAIYASASWMVELQPDTMGIPGLIIWTAAYGSNDGGRYSSAITNAGYYGTTHVHQYTSSGSNAGISSSGLDENWSYITIEELTGGSTDMLADERAALFNVLAFLVTGGSSTRNSDPTLSGDIDRTAVFGRVHDVQYALTENLPVIKDALARIETRLTALETGGVPATVDYARVAKDVNDEDDRRDRDGNAATGSTS